MSASTGFATSTMGGNTARRFSVRQAERKRNELDSISSSSCTVSRPSGLPGLLSPLSGSLSPSPVTAEACPSSPAPGASPSASEEALASPPPTAGTSHAPRSSFVPRRKPIGQAGCSNFRSQLNVNVGQDHTSDGTTDIHLPIDLIPEFERMASANTNSGLETGGILAGERKGSYFQVTHLIVPEQTVRSYSWEVHDERQINKLFQLQSRYDNAWINTHSS